MKVAGSGNRLLAMKGGVLLTVALLAALRSGHAQVTVPDTVSNCCEGDILLVLDSSGSISSYEFSRLLLFLTDLLHTFSLGRGQVRIGLLQVGTAPLLEFGLDAHDTQASLQKALLNTRQLQGDTNTEAALRLALDLLTKPETEPGPARDAALPKVLVWLTDGVQPGDVDEPMSELKERGVAVLAVSTGHGNYQVLRRSVTPPVENHLYFVDIDDIGIISDDLREAIIEIIRAERLRAMHVSSHSVTLQWRPVLSAGTGYYELRHSCVRKAEGDAHSDTGVGCTDGHYRRRTLSGDSSWVELTNLQPDTTYTASLTPESNQEVLNTLSITFTTLPEILSPAVVLVSDSAPHQLRVSWGPLQPARVQRYRVEYGAIPTGQVHTVSLYGHQNSTLLTGLEPDTQYLVTVSALHATGDERAMSVKACTQEAVLPALTELQLTPVDQEGTRVMWRGQEEGLRGYWISWEGQNTQNPSEPLSSSIYLPPGSLSTQLTHLAPHSRVCVSPVYTAGRGEGICCQAD
ncbi:von Willebrand factor A domain-containing protein 1-like [Lampris incognitus]|uniref:von Willebrand factor A domain-containing protein 1-like n=1 Tax=Lampris incognitus TaxID=2546036 RepID=UPI0024B4EBF7|nr:von Willebrand factor A domain-containing protein 1-like [Lampris incognitus]